MSYIRAGYPLVYVDGVSEDYVFPHTDGDIEDYGKVTDKGMIELLFRHWKTEDHEFKDYLLRKVAARLNVRLRGKPLTKEEREKPIKTSLATDFK
jgi:hypothetical protein